jgi:hypothetical protein
MNRDPLSATQKWLQTIIIQHNICPFAQREVERGSIRFVVDHDTDIERCLLHLIDECAYLDEHEDTETTLLIFDQAVSEFDDYLDFLELAQDLLLDQDYEGIYQLASFHPAYCFEGAETDDAANYTNRSPYPMLHILRETSIDRAVSSYAQVEMIPERNIELLRNMGLAKMQALLAACR